MSSIEEMISELYNNEDVSLGVHGTGLIKDEQSKKAKEILNNGLMCRYGDIRRTVSFQDRRKIHAHGGISLEDIKSYGYGTFINHNAFIYEEIRDGKAVSHESRKVELDDVTFVIAIPKELQTTEKELFCGERRMFSMEYARNESDLRLGNHKRLEGRPIDPKYIVGFYKDQDCNTFEFNEKFYGIRRVADTEEFEVDTDSLKAENDKVKRANQEKMEERLKKTGQEYGKETIKEQENTKGKGTFDRLINKMRENARKIFVNAR